MPTARCASRRCTVPSFIAEPAMLDAVFAVTGQRIRTLPVVRAPVVPPA